MSKEIQKISTLLTEFNSQTITISFDEQTKEFVVVVKSKDCHSTVFTGNPLENVINNL